ncbi:UPF0149 family protein [Catenovulum sp. 2E275]|uniref:UPF0149 family protein n=1 Tax=Catenovulum sp. 2E275 TaxID=2980497 RepID=UPI0021D081F2|nr:UPF0149 family protein [Catenovulum sp. 2E275]MCU4674323.1 UPF0149 family protein [Catenovulum sp. 2E275]
MTDIILPDYDQFDFFLHQNELKATAAEVHGIIAGCLCAGMPYKQADWLELVSEFVLQGADINAQAEDKFKELYEITYQQLLNMDYAFQIFLPQEDDIPLSECAQMLIEWLGAFIAAFGSAIGDKFVGLDNEVREAYQDLLDISQMDTDMEDDEENLIAFEEVVEYVRMTAILCFGELGDRKLEQVEQPKSPLLH